MKPIDKSDTDAAFPKRSEAEVEAALKTKDPVAYQSYLDSKKSQDELDRSRG